MRCLYEVLGVDKTADDDAIKKAYRKQALVWHPDKNQHRLEEADAAFKEIQNAYEVLSDKHERAWYDSHRDQILRSGERHQAGGGPGGFTPGERPEDEVDLFHYFTSSCYSGFRDGPKGFYGVYKDLFDTLAQQESSAWESSEASGLKNAQPPVFPTFGTSESPAVEVYAFYNFWSSFVTYKDFAWADLYVTAAAPNRQVRRRMEDENRKARRTQRREYLDNVRELVTFIKKRDKRVAKFQAEEAVRRAEQQAAEAARRQAEREERLRRAAEYEEPEWARQSEATAEDEEELSSEPEEVEQLYCIVCEKKFKSAGQLANHERSKAHREAVATLKEMLQDEEAWLLDEDAEGSGVQQQRQPQGASSNSNQGKNGKTKKQQQQQHTEPLGVEGTNGIQQQQQQQTQKDTGDSVVSSDSSQSDDDELPDEGDLLERMVAQQVNNSRPTSSKRKQRRQQQRQQQQASDGATSASRSESEDSNHSFDENELLARMVLQTRGNSQIAAAAQEPDHHEDGTSNDITKDAEELRTNQQTDLNSQNNDRSINTREAEEADQQLNDEDEDPMLAAAAGASSSGRGSRGRLNQQQQQCLEHTIAQGLDDLDLSSVTLSKASKKRRGKAAATAAAAAAAAVESNGDSSTAGEEPMRGRGSKRAAVQDKKQQRQQKKAQAEAAAAGLLCKVCGATFESRTQLFKHISSTGHAALQK